MYFSVTFLLKSDISDSQQYLYNMSNNEAQTSLKVLQSAIFHHSLFRINQQMIDKETTIKNNTFLARNIKISPSFLSRKRF